MAATAMRPPSLSFPESEGVQPIPLKEGLTDGQWSR